MNGFSSSSSALGGRDDVLGLSEESQHLLEESGISPETAVPTSDAGTAGTARDGSSEQNSETSVFDQKFASSLRSIFGEALTQRLGMIWRPGVENQTEGRDRRMTLTRAVQVSPG